MSAPGLLERPTDRVGHSGEWIVTVYDNPHNTVDEVIDVLMEATECSVDEARMETWEIDRLGQSVVHHGAQSECERVAEIIATIGIRVEVSKESVGV